MVRGIHVSGSDQANATLTLNLSVLAKTIFRVAARGLSGDLSGSLDGIADITAAFELNGSAQQRAGVLVTRALQRSMTRLMIEIANDDKDIVRRTDAAAFMELSNSFEIVVDNEFFRSPTNSDIVDVCIPQIEKWLSILDVPEHNTNNILSRFPSVFTQSLHDEWREKHEFYSLITESDSSPFKAALGMEDRWDRYRSYLSSLATERVFDESFSLRQIYIPLRCSYMTDKGRGSSEFGENRSNTLNNKQKLSWVHEVILEWISKADQASAVRTITGGPGSGKSSFAKMLAADLAEAGRNVLFVPLHLIDLDDGIGRSLGEYFKESGHFSEDPLKQTYREPLVLILDGLDEIQMQGKAAQESAQFFVEDVIRFIDRHNTQSCRILCMITGREIAVQSAENALRRDGQVLILLPYSLGENEKRQFDRNDALASLDQRDEWWTRYSRLTGADFEEMPKSLRAGELSEVTSQPLLNYLVALSYRRGLKLDESTNVNSVYADLLRAVYERAWARHIHPSVSGVSRENFVRLLEEVALSVWHGAGRTTTLSEVEAHCKQSKLGELLPSLQSGVSSGVSTLLLAFYFRQKGRRDDGDKTFEFTHKTFSEYLTALRVIRLIKVTQNQISMNDADYDMGLSEEDVLFRWISVCGPTALDTYLLGFIRREVSSLGSDECALIQTTLSRLLEVSLRTGWPVHRFDRHSFTEQRTYARNAEETLLACLNACALRTGSISVIKWPNETAAGEMISRLQGQRKGPVNKPFMDCLSYLNLSEQNLDISDFYAANLSYSILDRSHLNYSMMLLANLEGCSLVQASLGGAYIASASLTGARITFNQIVAVGSSRRDIAYLTPRYDNDRSSGRKSRLKSQIEMIQKLKIVMVDMEGNEMSPDEVFEAVQHESAENARLLNPELLGRSRISSNTESD